jgi:hypothetical protein
LLVSPSFLFFLSSLFFFFLHSFAQVHESDPNSVTQPDQYNALEDLKETVYWLWRIVSTIIIIITITITITITIIIITIIIIIIRHPPASSFPSSLPFLFLFFFAVVVCCLHQVISIPYRLLILAPSLLSPSVPFTLFFLLYVPLWP